MRGLVEYFTLLEIACEACDLRLTQLLLVMDGLPELWCVINACSSRILLRLWLQHHCSGYIFIVACNGHACAACSLAAHAWPLVSRRQLKTAAGYATREQLQQRALSGLMVFSSFLCDMSCQIKYASMQRPLGGWRAQ